MNDGSRGAVKVRLSVDNGRNRGGREAEFVPLSLTMLGSYG